MAILLTTKYSKKVDERYFPSSVSAFGTNQNYEWDGAQTIKVTSVGTVATKAYDRNTGYGAVSTADNLANTLQTMTLTQDKCFRAKLDKMDEEESEVKGAQVLAREMREVVYPEIEVYRFNKMCKNVLANTATGSEITATADAYDDFVKAGEFLDDQYIPEASRVAYVTPSFYTALKLSKNFIQASDMAQTMLIKGQVGEVDGVPIIKVNKNWLFTGNIGTAVTSATSYGCIIVDRNATVAPVKLFEYEKIKHPDFSGVVFQGRFYYDAFVLDMKKLGMVGVKNPTALKTK